MYYPIQLTTAISFIRTSIRRSLWRSGFLLIPLAYALGSFALSPTARAVDPPPDGGYPNGNTAEGQDALFSLGIGFNNTAVGFQALFSNTKGNDNTSVGYGALYQNVSGDFNTASGFQALYFNTTGKRNAAHGLNALYANTTGSDNTAIGSYALASNTTGRNNIGVGLSAGTVSALAVTISISVTLVSMVTPIRSASGIQNKGPPLSPALVVLPWREALA